MVPNPESPGIIFEERWPEPRSRPKELELELESPRDD